MTFSLHWEEPWGLHFRFLGAVTPEDTARLNLQVTCDPRFDDLRYVIADFLSAPEHFFHVRDANATALPFVPLAGAANSKQRPVVAVVTDSEAIRELMMTLRTSGFFPYTFEFFTTIAGAREWIAVRSQSLRKVVLGPMSRH